MVSIVHEFESAFNSLDMAALLRCFTAESLTKVLRRRLSVGMGGPDMAPHAPQRSERPGSPGALLDTPTDS